MLEFLRARAEKRYALTIKDASPVESVDSIWGSAAQIAIVGIFVILLTAALHVGRPLLLPVLAAMVIGTTFGPVVKYASKRGIPSWITALLVTLVLVTAVTLLV